MVKLRYPQGGVARYNVQSLESSEVLNASKVEIGVIFASLSTRLNVGGVLLSPHPCMYNVTHTTYLIYSTATSPLRTFILDAINLLIVKMVKIFHQGVRPRMEIA